MQLITYSNKLIKTAITMKKQLLFLVSLMVSLLTSSCAQVLILGNGNVTKKELPLSNFSGIDVSRGFNLYLSHDDSEKVTIEIDENLHEYVKAEVNSGTLIISAHTRIRNITKMNVYVSAKNIENIILKGGGNLIGENSTITDKIKIDAGGGGKLDMKLKTQELLLEMNGGGNAILEGEITKNSIHFVGGGDLKLNVTGTENEINFGGGGKLVADLNSKALNCTIKGGSNAYLSGNVDNADIQLSGGGDVWATEMQIENAIIQVSGGSDATLKVKNAINGEISGGGNLILHEKPHICEVKKAGGSQIKSN
jgi:hypothetical protein